LKSWKQDSGMNAFISRGSGRGLRFSRCSVHSHVILTTDFSLFAQSNDNMKLKAWRNQF
jgi:hypothetical protein